MENCDEMSGPWRATRLWNDIIRTIRAGMPMRKHKKNLRTYENCFSSADAIDWLHKTLQKNSNFGPDVTREQTVQLLQKLYRAGIIENVRDEAEDAFREAGELYRISNKSPVRNLRTPGKTYEKRTVLADVANTPVRSVGKETLDELTEEVKVELRKDKRGDASGGSRRRRRDASRIRKAKEEEAKKELNLSFFQSLLSNSLILLDNDFTWKRVFCKQLESCLSSHHVRLLDQRDLLNMDNVTHNMTHVSSKGIVQIEDKPEDLPHWVLSAMKCLANWPRQLRSNGGKESCLPNYPGFEQDVFNVVKDYFLSLKEPLTTFSLYEFFTDAWVKAEAVVSLQVSPQVRPFPQSNQCNIHPGSSSRPCSRPYTISSVDDVPFNPTQFYSMEDAYSEDFLLLNNQEREAKIKQTFAVLPPLATSSVRTADSSNSTMFSSVSSSGNSALSHDMSTTAIMRNFLPPNTCFETAFHESSPKTRIVPQAKSETLHFSRSGSGRSVGYAACGVQGTIVKSSTQTQTESLKRLPRWKRNSRLRKSIAVMEGNLDEMGGPAPNNTPRGVDNPGFAKSPCPSSLSAYLSSDKGQTSSSSTQNSSSVSPPSQDLNRLSYSMDNIFGDEKKEDFLLKYRQFSGDLVGGQDLVARARSHSVGRCKDNSVIQSKTVRKEKRKSRCRDSSSETGLSPDMQKVKLVEDSPNPSCYLNPALDVSSEPSPRANLFHAPLATEELDLSPVPGPFLRNSKYNNSYRIANNQPSTPKSKLLPRTSTKVALVHPTSKVPLTTPQSHILARAEPYLCINSDVSEQSTLNDRGNNNIPAYSHEPVYTVAGPGPIRRYQVNPPTTNTIFKPRLETIYCSPPNPCPPNLPYTQPTVHVSHPEEASCPNHCTAPADTGGGLRCQESCPMHCPRIERTTLRSSSYSQADSGRSSLPPVPFPSPAPAATMFSLLGLLLPPHMRRKLQLLLKFILKISVNRDLRLDTSLSNADLSLKTFVDVILRAPPLAAHNSEVCRAVVGHFLENYDLIWSPSQALRKEVEEAVYKSLVNRRLEAGEDPYPVTFCQQVTRAEYERNKFTGSQMALMDLLETIIKDEKMAEKNKKKKLKKFKESYPEMWRSRFPSTENEPDVMSLKKEKSVMKLGTLSRFKSVIRM